MRRKALRLAQKFWPCFENRMKATAENKPVRVLVEVKDAHGSTVGYEWREVPGTEISLEGVELKNGDTLTIESSERRS